MLMIKKPFLVNELPDQTFTAANGVNSVLGWSTFETYLLHELINHLADHPAITYDATTIHAFYSQLASNFPVRLNQKDVKDVRKKMMELKNNDDTFQIVVRSQLNVL